MDTLKVFVGGLPQHSTRESLNNYFGQFGSADSFIMVDKATGRSRGFGFVNFHDEQTVATVLSHPLHEVDGMQITVSPYQNSGGGGGPRGGGGGGGGNAYVPLVPPGGGPTYGYGSGGGAAASSLMPKPVATRDQMKIFVGGLSQNTTRDSLNLYFSQFGYADSFVMLDKATGRSRGFGFVNFQDEHVLNAVLTMQHEVDGQPITVSAYADKNCRSIQPERAVAQPLGGAGAGAGAAGGDVAAAQSAISNLANVIGTLAAAVSGGSADNATISNSLLGVMQQPQIAGLLSKVQEQAGALVGAAASGGAAHAVAGAPSGGSLPKIFVGGLAQHTTRDSLNQYFSQFGSVDSVVMMDKSTGRSRGFGFVDFQDESVMHHVLQYAHQIDGSNVTCSAYASKNGGGGGGAQPINISTTSANDILANAMGSINKLQEQIAAQFTAPGGVDDALGLAADVGGSSVPGKLFVGDLTQEETTEMLQEAMSSFGPCECEVMIDKRTGRSRGFGFARFVHETDMLAALSAQIFVNGKQVEVSECWGKGHDPRGGKGGSKGGGKGGKSSYRASPY